MQTQLPLILLTNDHGIESDGLWAAAKALLNLGEVLVVAPDQPVAASLPLFAEHLKVVVA